MGFGYKVSVRGLVMRYSCVRSSNDGVRNPEISIIF